jgi:hypothetical protein
MKPIEKMSQIEVGAFVQSHSLKNEIKRVPGTLPGYQRC